MHSMLHTLLDVQVIAIKVATARVRRSKMGFKNPLDYNRMHHQVYMAGVELHHPGNDGFTQFEIKKDLHRIKWLIDEIIADAPTFAGEDEFLKEHEQVKMWRTLKK
jgi:hypothetical protein